MKSATTTDRPDHERPADVVDRLIAEIKEAEGDSSVNDELTWQLRDALICALHSIEGTQPTGDDFENRKTLCDHLEEWLRGSSRPRLMPVFNSNESKPASESLRIPCYVVASKDSSPMKVFVDLDPIRAYDDADFYVQQAGEYGIADCHISFDRQ